MTSIILLGLFFLSGAVGVAYEIVFVRQLSLLFGVSIYAVSAVLVAFMAGLGIGAFWFGRILDKGFSAVRLYAIFNITEIHFQPPVRNSAIAAAAHSGQYVCDTSTFASKDI